MKTTKWLVATMLLSAAWNPSAVLANTGSTFKGFSDLDGVAASVRERIQEAQKQGLLTGDPTGQFRPNEHLTRQELATLLAKALKLNEPSLGKNSSFDDVPAASWSASAIAAVVQKGLMVGDEQGSFRPNDPVSREELAAVFVRTVGGVDVRGGLRPNVQDAQQVSTWAESLVDAAIRLGLIDTSDGKLNPKGLVEREEIAGFLLDIFQAGEMTTTISNVNGDMLMIDGKPYMVDGKWKSLLGERNAQALEGASVRFKSTNRSIIDFSDLEIVQNGVVFDLSGTPYTGNLRISGNGITVKIDSLGQLYLANGVSNVEINAQIKSLIVGGGQAVQLNGNAQIETLQVTDPQTRLTLGDNVVIREIQMPPGVRLSQIIVNLDQVSDRIKYVQTGIDDRYRNSPSPTRPTPAPVNHAPKVKNAISSVTANVSDGDQTVSLVNVFEDADHALTYTAVSSNAGVATVDINGTDLTLKPVSAGMTTITVTANDGRGGTASTSFTLTLNPAAPVNHAPTVKNAISPVTASVTDGVQTVSLANVFDDADQDALTYTVVSSNAGIATATVNGASLSITPVNAGTTTITVTANDGRGGTATTSFTLTLNPAAPVNHAPEVDAMIYEQVLTAGVTNDRTYDLSQLFVDSDGDTLTFTAVPLAPGIVAATVSGNYITLSPGSTAGTTVVRVTADDGKGGTATYNVSVRNVPLAPGGLVNITKQGDSIVYDLSDIFPGQFTFVTYVGTPDSTFIGPSPLTGNIWTWDGNVSLLTWVIDSNGTAVVLRVTVNP